jgi:hypothetical protein
MLLKQATLAGIAAGTITCAYRRWRKPLVRAGSTFRTSIGVIAVDHIEPTTLDAITASGVRHAGYRSRAALIAALRRGTGDIYWIRLRRVGVDPRIALRARKRWTKDQLVDIKKRIERFDRASPTGPWALKTLRLIAKYPGVRAADLAAKLGSATLPFKVRVRRLKELGLTESLEVGYRLSPRGAALLKHLV